MKSNAEQYKFIDSKFVIDRKLYKYFSNVRYAIDCIQNRRIHLDDPRKFNDPFDGAFVCNFSKTQGSYSEKELVSQFINKIHAIPEAERGAHFREIFNNLLDLTTIELSRDKEEQPATVRLQNIYSKFSNINFSLQEFTDVIDAAYFAVDPLVHLICKMSCFSEISDSVLMWAYYGNSHKGICVEFDLSRLDTDNELNQQILRNISKVHYSPLRADRQFGGNDDSWANFLLSKADAWEHEHEWRLVCETTEEYLPFDCISNVFLGVNFNTESKQYKELINAVSTYESLNIYQYKTSVEKYILEPREIYSAAYITALKKALRDQAEPSKV